MSTEEPGAAVPGDAGGTTETAAPPDGVAAPAEKKKRGFQFPSAVTTLALVTVLVWVAVIFIPAGRYDTAADGSPKPGTFREVDSPLSAGERVAQLILGRAKKAKDRDWLQAIIAGAAGSFLAGSAGSMLFGEGFQFKPAGIVGSIIGAVVVVAIWNAVRARQS